MRAAQSLRRRGIFPLLAILLGWAAPCFALTELSGSPPWQMNIAGETYQFASSLGDSIQYDGTSAVLQFQAANITLNARGFTITHYSGVANELIQLSSTGARINQLRSVNLELEFPSGADAIFDGCDFEIRHLNFGATPFASKLVSLTSSSSDVRFWNCRLASVSTRDMIDVAGTTHSFENCLAISTNQEAFLLNGVGPYSIIGCTIGGFGQGAVVSSMSNPATLAFYNNILLTSDEICFEATDATWTGWTQSNNWYNGPNPLITYGGVNYSDASTFEANSDNGDPLLVDADETIRGDYRVANGSGPVDQGDSARNTLIFDLLGNPRERGTIDMGCYEYQPSDQGSCCFADGSCVVTTQSLCLGDSGTWTEGETCTPNNCDQVGACCAGQDECSITLDSLCNGTFLGEGSVCDPGVCIFGCPPPGYIEITQDQLPIFIGQHNSKWAVCDSLVVDNTFGSGSNWAAITIAASNVSLTGSNVGSVTVETTDGGSRQLLQLRRPQSGTRIRDISFHCRIDNTGETSCYLQHDDFSFRNVSWTGWDFVNVYANVNEPLLSGAVFDSCSFFCDTGVLGFTTTGNNELDRGWEDLSITNCSFISNEPCPPGDFDNKPLRIHYGHNLTFNHNVVITRNAGDGVGGGADDTEPVGFYDILGDSEIGWNYFYTDNNRVSGATGRSGFISVRSWSTGVYIHDNYIRSGYKTLNVGGGGRHRVIRNVIFGGMDVPQYGGTEASAVQISGTDPPLPPDGNLPGHNRFESNLIVSYGSPFFMSSTRGADSLVCNTVINLTGGTDDPSAIEFGSFCDPQFGTEYLRNNIFVSTLASDPVLDVNTGCQDLTIDADYNLYWNRGGGPIAKWTNGTTYATLAAFQSGASQEANGLSGNPGLVAPVATWGDTLADYRLSALSLAIDQGDSTWLAFATDLDSLDRVVAAAVDLGAYEFTDVVPTLQGACCQVDGTCSVSTESDCEGLLGGTYEGDNTVCDPNPCPILTQACCFPDATCDDLTPSACTTAGGFPRGSGTTCATVTCASNGACCFASGSCAVLSEALCAFVLGQFQGPGTDCDPNPCAQPTGACCIAEVCSITTGAGCAGDYQGNGTTCTPDPCDLPDATGACCFAFSFCQVITESACGGQGGTYEGDGTDCDPNPCPETLGACCASDGSCTLDDVTDCADAGGAWYGAGSVCADTDCPQPTGACCLAELVGGSCIVSTEDACLTANGEWHQGEHCDDVDCTRSITGGTRVIYGEATWISSFGSTVNHCDGTTLRLGGTPTPLSDGNLVIRFTTPALPAGARVIGAEIVGTVVTTTAGAEPGDIEVYQLARDPVICEATWEIYATGSDWGEDGGLAIPSDRILPALTDQLGDGSTLTAGTELDLVTGPAALRFADSLLRTGTASILVTCEVDHVWLSGDLGAAPVRMTLTYAVGSNRRRTKAVSGQ